MDSVFLKRKLIEVSFFSAFQIETTELHLRCHENVLHVQGLFLIDNHTCLKVISFFNGFPQ